MKNDAFERFARRSLHHAVLGFTLDWSRTGFEVSDVARLGEPLSRALDAMAELEAGSVANPDEGRRVGHYWLRAPELAPEADLRAAIKETSARVLSLAASVEAGTLAPPAGGRFRHALVVGIGGSALGPQLVIDALGGLREAGRALDVHFADNTDPDGFERHLERLSGELGATLVVVISKSGGTKETRNGMLEVSAAYARAGLDFGRHAIAITQAGSELDRYAHEQRFLATLPMWDWVGGRTSVTSAVGLFPAALAGIDVAALVDGAATMDRLTRARDPLANPAVLLAAAWHLLGEGRGRRAMVMLPYKDRLELSSRYLQQLVMESLGKREDRAGKVVSQGLTVYGNKGSTDQHAYVQQLLDGPDDFFVTFIEVLRDRRGEELEVEPGVTSGDYLSAFMQGTRRALADRGKRSLTLTFEVLDARTLGAYIALYERAVGLYAELIGINAYHQPAVESGKRAAAAVLALQVRAVACLHEASGDGLTAPEVAAAVATEDVDALYVALRHLAANGRLVMTAETDPRAVRFARRG
jgi:glucose-6-phosphate isomerase